MNIFVGNLNFSTTEETLHDKFAEFGTVESVNIITHRDTGRSRGFGFVNMPDDDEARAAIAALDGTNIDGREARVNESEPRDSSRGKGNPPRRSRY